jgi:hypothetical protein
VVVVPVAVEVMVAVEVYGAVTETAEPDNVSTGVPVQTAEVVPE